jgi:hypothetical protein
VDQRLGNAAEPRLRQCDLVMTPPPSSDAPHARIPTRLAQRTERTRPKRVDVARRDLADVALLETGSAGVFEPAPGGSAVRRSLS